MALLMVRAELADAADRPAFDRWYATEHLPDALKVFQAARAWRCWSAVDSSVHYAFYQFAGLEAAQSILQSAGMRTLIAEFDRAWGARVRRTRDILDVVQSVPAQAAGSEGRATP
jgi:DNA-binding GntR family transcriptional regulator